MHYIVHSVIAVCSTEVQPFFFGTEMILHYYIWIKYAQLCKQKKHLYKASQISSLHRKKERKKKTEMELRHPLGYNPLGWSILSSALAMHVFGRNVLTPSSHWVTKWNLVMWCGGQRLSIFMQRNTPLYGWGVKSTVAKILYPWMGFEPGGNLTLCAVKGHAVPNNDECGYIHLFLAPLLL